MPSHRNLVQRAPQRLRLEQQQTPRAPPLEDRRFGCCCFSGRVEGPSPAPGRAGRKTRSSDWVLLSWPLWARYCFVPNKKSVYNRDFTSQPQGIQCCDD